MGVSQKKTTRFSLYNLNWAPYMDRADIELQMLKFGGIYKKKNGQTAGEGMLFHMKRFTSLVWPHIIQHRWFDLIAENYIAHRTIAIMGPASSGKTTTAAILVLIDYYTDPSATTVICCSTTKESLENRVWGEIKKLHAMARRERQWLPGYLIEGRQRIVTDLRTADNEGRDFRNGLMGIPVYQGGSFQGISGLLGIKNKNVRLLADELSFFPRVFVDSVSNLDKNPGSKVLGLGNPKDTTDALGVLAEPATELGGWQGGIDQASGSKTWATKRPMGVCIQLDGEDSPNLDGSLGIGLITQADIDRDLAFYGRESLWFTMMNLGRMPRGQGTRRVLTDQMCRRGGALKLPNWKGTNLRRIAFLDAGYGGDRCIFGELEWGEEAEELTSETVVVNLLNQDTSQKRSKHVISLSKLVIVPVKSGPNEIPVEYQIAEFVRNQCETDGIPPNNVFIESGMRTALVNAFAKTWGVVESVDCMAQASEDKVSADINIRARDYYDNFITELWFSVRLVVENGQFRGMTDDAKYEFCSREWTYKATGSKKIKVEPKEKMKMKTGRSPDVADGIAIGVYGARKRGFVVARLKSMMAARKTNEWKRRLKEKETATWSGLVLDSA